MKQRRSPIPIASHLVTQRVGYTHHGIYLGRNRVIHYGGLSESFRSAPVSTVSLATFCAGKRFWAVKHPNASYRKNEVVRRALSRLGEDKYDIASNNCEQFVFWAIEDYHHSEQVSQAAPIATAGAASAAGLVARGVVASAGSIAGLSGPGVMSGLAAVGGTIGAGAVGGIGVLGCAGGLAAASMVNSTILKDDPSLSQVERDSRSTGRKATYAGAAAGTAGSIAAVAAAGAPGLSAAGITSGLAAIGSSVGGGMAAGVTIATAAPVVAAVALGFGVYKLVQRLKK